MDNGTTSLHGVIGYNSEIENIQKTIADFGSGKKTNIAIISEPFAGRTTLLDAMEEMPNERITRITLSSIIKNKNAPAFPETLEKIVLVDNCHLLYMRKIGGFDVLEDFLRSITGPDHLFITTWNIYSWNYLDAAINIGNYFPVQIKLPPLNKGVLKELIMSRYKKDELMFVEDAISKDTKVKFIHFSRIPVTIKPLEKTIEIPFVDIHFNLLRSRLLPKKEEKITAEDIIFELISDISNGNPGIALVVWGKNLEYPVIKPSYIKKFSGTIYLDYNEAFILNIILSMESINSEELEEIAGSDHHIDNTLSKLSNQELINIKDGQYSIRPESMYSTVDFLKKARLVW
ncbi:MAG: hypothetical protein JXA98_06465 [Methanosarcinaceae archaeon]|nr:hypothetical protein [Methanosarcinaceae archaeon]